MRQNMLHGNISIDEAGVSRNRHLERRINNDGDGSASACSRALLLLL